jgi:hypothetical protein
MPFEPGEIMSILDNCCEAFTFPMLDNGYVYLAATRLSLYRSMTDWAMVIEVFGFSPRVGLPDTSISTFASRLHDRNPSSQYVSRVAYENYLADNAHYEYRSVFPIANGSWQAEENEELVAADAAEVVVRGQPYPLPSFPEYLLHGIDLEDSPRVRVAELCRYLAGVARDHVLASPREQRISVPPGLSQILTLEEWNHPDLASGERASDSETFRQLAEVLATGDTGYYRPSLSSNTHWRNWPEGGTL